MRSLSNKYHKISCTINTHNFEIKLQPEKGVQIIYM